MRLLPILLLLSCTPRVATVAVNDNIAVETVQQVDKPLFRLGEPFGDVPKHEIKAVEGLKDVDLYIDQSKERSEGRRVMLKATVRVDTVVREIESCVRDTVYVAKGVENKSSTRNALIAGVISSLIFLALGYYLRGYK